MWEYNVQTPLRLQRKFPHLIHVEEQSINHPNWHKNEIRMIFEEEYKFDWHQNYVVHLWNTVSKINTSPNRIKKLNSAFGEMARMVYYGDEQMILDD